jgi:hypothetical protein
VVSRDAPDSRDVDPRQVDPRQAEPRREAEWRRDADPRRESSRGPTEGLIAEFVKRFIETGAKGLASEPLRQLLGEMKLPRDALLQLLSQQLVSQFDDTKRVLYRSFSKELRRFFGRTHFADELATALTKVSVQVNMSIRFSPAGGKPEVKSHIRVTPDEAEVPGAGEQQGTAGESE